MIGATARKDSLGILYKPAAARQLQAAILEALTFRPVPISGSLAERLSPECFVAALRDGLGE
jgi:hypothetical protein